MIEFLTLFVGLVSGPQDVEMRVSSPAIGTLELRLDGETVETLAAPPWKVAIDLGDGLKPHRITAVALDGNGREIGRAEQRLNQPRAAAEVGLLLERDGSGTPVAALVNWQSASGAEPIEIRAALDGR